MKFSEEMAKMLGHKFTVALMARRFTSTGRSMNAWVCDEYKKPLLYRQVEMPEVKGQNQILVKVAVGI